MFNLNIALKKSCKKLDCLHVFVCISSIKMTLHCLGPLLKSLLIILQWWMTPKQRELSELWLYCLVLHIFNFDYIDEVYPNSAFAWENQQCGFWPGPDTNQAVQPLEMATGLEILYLGSRGIVLSKWRKTKALISFASFFSHMQNVGFLMTRLI